jgi:hypothetical protein
LDVKELMAVLVVSTMHQPQEVVEDVVPVRGLEQEIPEVRVAAALATMGSKIVTTWVELEPQVRDFRGEVVAILAAAQVAASG